MEENKPCLLKRVFRPLELLLTLGVVVIFAVVLIEVASRYLLHQSIAWGSEVCQTLLVWITFIGGAVALFYNEHMEIDLLLNRASSPRVRAMMLLAGDIAILAFLVYGTIGGVKLVDKTWNMTTTTLQMPAGVLYLAFPAGCILMVAVVLSRMTALVKGLWKRC